MKAGPGAERTYGAGALLLVSIGLLGASGISLDQRSREAVTLLAAGGATFFLLAHSVYRQRPLDLPAIVGTLTGVAALVFTVAPDPATRLIGSPQCEAVDANGTKFLAETDGLGYAAITEYNEGRGITIRENPEVGADTEIVGRLVPGLCLVGFEGFCIGQAVPELTDPEGPLDQIWFSLPEERGFVAAAAVQELAPGAIGKNPLGRCDESEEPTDIELTMSPERIVKRGIFRFEAPNAVTVGAAAYFDGTDGPGWYQIGLDKDASDGFQIPWKSVGVSRQQNVAVVYSICWAGFVPGRAFDVATVDLLNAKGRAASIAPPPEDQLLGRAEACASLGGGA